MNKEIKSEARLTFIESTSLIVGHGVGSGVLAVPFLASRNSWIEFIMVVVTAYLINLLLHLMIGELSYNNDGAHFVKCFENELFKGRFKSIATWIVFALLGLSVVVNVSGFITGAGAVFTSWLGLSSTVSMLIYYVLVGGVVYFGMKLVGICEKYSVLAMVLVVAILFVATLNSETYPLPNKHVAPGNLLALYSMVAFSLSAVMSVPQVVKGVNGDKKKIRMSIAAGTGVNILIIIIITFMTLIGTGTSISENGALVDLSAQLGGWVSIVGYIFSLLAVSTSFWANTLNLRDIVDEQTKLGSRISWLVASLPCLFIALLGLQSFVGFARLAGVIQVLTGIGIILAFNRSRKHAKTEETICGRFGTLPFQIIVILSSVIATLGSVIKIK